MIERETRMRIRRHEFFQDFVDSATTALTKQGIAPDLANLAASELADWVAAHWGGQNLNIPMDYRRALTKLELEIYAEFDGSNYAEIARRRGMTDRSVRRYVNRIRAKLQEAARKGQGDLLHNEQK